MDLTQITLFSAMKHRMSYLGERQAVIAQNIANADTPGYKPMDLKKVNFSELASNSTGGLQPTVTHSGHMTMGNGGMGGNSGLITEQLHSFDTTPTGNAVSIEEQMLKMNEIAHDYHATTSLYKKMTTMMSMAIGDNR